MARTVFAYPLLCTLAIAVSGMSPMTETPISVTINGEKRTVPDGYPLTDVLRELEVDPDDPTGVAVAINESVIRTQDWDGVTLSEDDTVEVIQAQQGG